MKFDAMFYLVTLNFFLGCAVFGFLCWAWALGRRVQALRKNLADTRQSADSRANELTATLADLSAEYQAQRAIAAARMPAASLNLSKRSQAVALFRKGETTEAIAGMLALPKAEVELLVKVQQAVGGELPAPRNGRHSFVLNA